MGYLDDAFNREDAEWRHHELMDAMESNHQHTDFSSHEVHNHYFIDASGSQTPLDLPIPVAIAIVIVMVSIAVFVLGRC